MSQSSLVLGTGKVLRLALQHGLDVLAVHLEQLLAHHLAQVDAQQRLSLAALAKALGGGWSGK